MIECDNKGARLGWKSWWHENAGHDKFVREGGIISCEGGMDEVDSVGVRSSGWLSQIAKEKGM